MKVIVWAPTLKDCWTWVAALKSTLPAWLASRVQVPAAWKETTPALIEQTPDDAASTVITGVRPEVAVAVGV